MHTGPPTWPTRRRRRRNPPRRASGAAVHRVFFWTSHLLFSPRLDQPDPFLSPTTYGLTILLPLRLDFVPFLRLVREERLIFCSLFVASSNLSASFFFARSESSDLLYRSDLSEFYQLHTYTIRRKPFFLLSRRSCILPLREVFFVCRRDLVEIDIRKIPKCWIDEKKEKKERFVG